MEPASSGFCSCGPNSAQISLAAPGAKKRRARCTTRLRLSRCRSLTVGPARVVGHQKLGLGRGLGAFGTAHATMGMRMPSRAAAGTPLIGPCLMSEKSLSSLSGSMRHKAAVRCNAPVITGAL